MSSQTDSAGMKYATFEFCMSMILQCTLLLSVTFWLPQNSTLSGLGDRMWSATYLTVLELMISITLITVLRTLIARRSTRVAMDHRWCGELRVRWEQ